MKHNWESERGDIVSFEIDLDRIMRRYANRALRAKTGKATALCGLVKATVTEKRLRPSEHEEVGDGQ